MMKPSASDLVALVELANKLVWKQPDLNVLRPEHRGKHSVLASALEDHLKLSDTRGKLLLPDLRAFANETVAVFSDYSGEGSGKYYTYSFLICALNFPLTRSCFCEQMKEVRERHVLADKEIAFKDFGMGQLQRALPEYLELLDKFVLGFLLTVAVDKRIVTCFGPLDRSTKDAIARLLATHGLGKRKPNDAEKLLRVVDIGAYLTGLLAHNGQKLFWMTDHDAICPNEELHRQTLNLFHRLLLNLYARPGYSFPVVGGAVPFPERHLDTLDLLSAADIVAGSVGHCLTRNAAAKSADVEVKPGSQHVLKWLAHDGIGLKKMTLTLRPGPDDKIQTTTLGFGPEELPEGVTLVPVSV
jgi:hypothetical protein